MGLEPTLGDYLDGMVAVFRECRRVLRDDGTFWLVMGDSFAGAGKTGGATKKQSTNVGSYVGGKQITPKGLKPKDLMMVPARLAIALCDDGWWLRSDIIWAKPNPMPESCRDRPTSAHEHIFLLTKSARYFYDAEAVKEQSTEPERERSDRIGCANGHTVRHSSGGMMNGVSFRNLRNVWTITPQGFKGAHFATFPTDIPRRCIKAGCPVGGTVLDPFAGSGTTGMVADQLGRNSILLELNPAYAAMARARIFNDAPMFANVEVA